MRDPDESGVWLKPVEYRIFRLTPAQTECARKIAEIWAEERPGVHLRLVIYPSLPQSEEE